MENVEVPRLRVLGEAGEWRVARTRRSAGNNSPHSRFLHSVICHRHPCQEVRPSRDSHPLLPHPTPKTTLPPHKPS